MEKRVTTDDTDKLLNKSDEVGFEILDDITSELISNDEDTECGSDWVIFIPDDTSPGLASPSTSVVLYEQDKKPTSEGTDLRKTDRAIKLIFPREEPKEEAKAPANNGAIDIQQILAEIDHLEEQEKEKVARSVRETITTNSFEINPVDVDIALIEIDYLEQQKKKVERPLIIPPKPKTVRETDTMFLSRDTTILNIEEMLAELEEIDEKERSRPRPVGADISKVRPRNTARLASDDDANLKQTLAETSFIEGNEALSVGDRVSAIRHYRDALNYAPDNDFYYLNLAEQLAEDIGTVEEAEYLFLKGIELAPTNMELRAKLAELRGKQNKARPESSTPEKDTADPDTVVAVTQEPKPELRRSKTSNLRRARSILPEAFRLPQKISLANRLVIAIFLGALFWSVVFVFSGGQAKVEIKLLYPPDSSAITVDRLELQWQGMASNYRLQIRENGKKVLERVTQEPQYNLRSQERLLFKPKRRYTWQVTPYDSKGQELPYITEESQFKVLPLPNSARK